MIKKQSVNHFRSGQKILMSVALLTESQIQNYSKIQTKNRLYDLKLLQQQNATVIKHYFYLISTLLLSPTKIYRV